MESKKATQLRQVDLIIWNEAPSRHRGCLEVVHRLLCDLKAEFPIHDPDDEITPLFGGVPVILHRSC